MRNLYELFRDGVIDDAIKGNGKTKVDGTHISPWNYLPEKTEHVGRVQTIALIRRFMQKASKEFPQGIVLNKSGFKVSDDFVVFTKTHKEMGTSHEDMVKSWEAMSSMTT